MKRKQLKERIRQLEAEAQAAWAEVAKLNDKIAWPWCITCQSYHHPELPTCRKNATRGPTAAETEHVNDLIRQDAEQDRVGGGANQFVDGLVDAIGLADDPVGNGIIRNALFNFADAIRGREFERKTDV